MDVHQWVEHILLTENINFNVPNIFGEPYYPMKP